MFNLIPFRNHNEDNLFNYLDNIEKQFFGDLSGDISDFNFRTDIIEKDDKYILQAELPGFKKEDIKIDLNDDMLVISAEHSEEKEKKDKDNTYIRKERKYGSFSRSFRVADIDTDKITAAYTDGVLELDLPKKEIPKKESKRIDIK